MITDKKALQEQIDILLSVQKVDTELYKLKEEKAVKPAKKKDYEQAFEQFKQGLKAKEDELRTLQLKRKEYEIELETKEKETKKLQSQLFQIKNNKEYTALQKEIGGKKADSAVLEDDILRVLDKLDKVKAAVEEEKRKLIDEEQKVKARTGQIDQEIREIEEKAGLLEKEREQLCAGVDKAFLVQYERILKAKNSLALVPIMGEFCGGCNRELTAHLIDEARKKDQLIICESCSRLLYWDE